MIPVPNAEEAAALKLKYAARFPERFDFKVIGDGDKQEELPLILGTPDLESDEWNATVGHLFKPRKNTIDNAALVAESLLWPDPATWGGIVKRWPLLPDTVFIRLRRKFGGALAALSMPAAGAAPPEPIASALSATPAAVWRQFTPDGATAPFHLAITPPELGLWRIFDGEMNKDGARYWPLVRDLALKSVIASSLPVEQLFAQWPGAALLVSLVVTSLGGLAAESEKKDF